MLPVRHIRRSGRIAQKEMKTKQLLYKPVGWMLGAMGRLPFGVLYLISDVIFVVLYHVVRYRRKVALKNIADSFPDKDARWHRATCRRFFRHLADYFVETIKLPYISDDEMRRRMEMVGVDTVDRLLDQGRSVVFMFSHCGNWEWGTSITLWSRHKPSDSMVWAQVYRPLRNKFFDRYFLYLRSRFGSVSFEKKFVLRHLLELRREGKKCVAGFMSDQKPSHGDVTHVVDFLHHPTAMITGTETLCRKLDMAVVYWDMEKPSRGHYRFTVRPIADHPAELPPFAVTDTYAAMLQDTIRRTPSIWLWSHKRWKHPVQFPSDSTPAK